MLAKRCRFFLFKNNLLWMDSLNNDRIINFFCTTSLDVQRYTKPSKVKLRNKSADLEQ